MSAPTIAIDFDGTLVEHRYPEIGDEVPDAVYWCQQWVKAGARLILYTMRSNEPIESGGRWCLEEALKWCTERGIELWAVNENPEQAAWSSSPKVYAHRYVDDAAAGAPLIQPPSPEGALSPPRPYLDWNEIGPDVLDFILETA